MLQAREHALRCCLAVAENVGERQGGGLVVRVADLVQERGVAVLDAIAVRIDDDDAVIGLIDERLVT